MLSALAMALPLLAIAANSQSSKRGLLPTDLASLREAGDAQLSPDGAKVAYVVGETSQDRTRTISHIWIVPTAGGEAKRLTSGDAGESTPRWSPDGRRIAFYSNRDGRDGLWMAPVAGGEPRLVSPVHRTNFYLPKAGESFCWSPDGKQIAFLSSIEVLNDSPAPPTTPDPKLAGLPAAATRPLTRDEIDKLPVEIRELLFRAQGQAMGVRRDSPIEAALSPLPDDPRVITRLQYKSRTSFSDNLQSHIFVADLESPQPRRQARMITTGLHYEHSIHWSPRGDEIVFVSNREPDPDRVNNTDLFAVNVQTFAIRQLTKTPGCEWQPVFSPDGSRIAYLATRREITTIDSIAEDTHAFVLPAQGGEPVSVSRDLDRRVLAVKWWRDGKRVAFMAYTMGRTALYLSDPKTPLPLVERPFDADAQLAGFSIGPGEEIAYAASDAAHPPEIYAQSATLPESQTEIRLGPARRLTALHAPLEQTLQFSTMREFRFKSDALDIHGWLVPPVDLDEKRSYPVILNVHGGPHSMHGYGFNPTVQALAARGYAVLMINPRGSAGYGQKFADGCVNDWGGGDYRDLMKGLDEALARWPFLDKTRLGVMGGSYGGYMTNWVVTQTDRFRAAVASASLSNLISFYSTSLYQDLVHAEFNGFPWNNFEQLWNRSPLRHVARVKTPLLLIHGEQDNDVHITQAEEMYTAVRMRGIETTLVRYPREGHGFHEPRHRMDSLARTLLWFDRFLKQ
ncbi:MAG: S9 family peptidase [Blastocatellia bacterium]|nr:S9 family peptidase [Blastocatellia bacterium]